MLRLRVNILEEGREHRFTQGFSTTKMTRMKDTKMKKRLKSSSKSWTPATETFLWQVFSFLSVVLQILGFTVLYVVNYEKPYKKGVVCIVREWENAEGISHHFRQSDPSLTSIFEILSQLISLDGQQHRVWLEHASAHFQPARLQTLSARKPDPDLAVV